MQRYIALNEYFSDVDAKAAAYGALGITFGERFDALTAAQRVALVDDVYAIMLAENLLAQPAADVLDARIAGALASYAATLVAGRR